MSETNLEIVEKYYEFQNAQQLERMIELVSETAVLHGVDFVGTGFNMDSSSGKQIVISQVFEGGEAFGKLEVGDVLTRAKTNDQIMESFEDLSNLGQSPARLGTQLDMTIQRNGVSHDYSFTRSHIPAPEFSFRKLLQESNKYIENLQFKIQFTVAEGDKIVVYSTFSYLDKTYNVTVIGTDCTIFRLESGKIVEVWSLDDNSNQMKQLGFQFIPPAKATKEKS